MSAYVVVEFTVTDPGVYREKYSRTAPGATVTTVRSHHHWQEQASGVLVTPGSFS